MAYYRAQSGYNRSGSITLIRADSSMDWPPLPRRMVGRESRRCERRRGAAFREDAYAQIFSIWPTYYSRLVPVPQYTDFDEQLSRTVLFSDYTDRIYSAVEYGSYGFFDVRTCCGLSTYIPATRVAFA